MNMIVLYVSVELPIVVAATTIKDRVDYINFTLEVRIVII